MPFQKGNKINVGRKLTDYQKRMVSLAQKGKPKSEGTKIKLSLALKGRKCPWVREANKKRLGEKHPMYGKSLTWLKGEKNNNWKGGITTKDKLERSRFRQQIQKQVFKRDNYKCVLCGEGGALTVDHIQPWAEYVELRFNINNCRTLCQECHYKITYGKPMPPLVRAWGHNFSRRVIL